MIKGTNMGTVADANGYYVFPGVDEDAVLVFTTIGFVTSEIPVNGRAVINATLAEDVLKLSEVVVVGYNTVRRAQVTGAIETVKADRIADELPFYESGGIKKNPRTQVDVDIIKKLITDLKPHMIFMAGDLADPHGTHRVCTEAALEAVEQLREEGCPWIADTHIW